MSTSIICTLYQSFSRTGACRHGIKNVLRGEAYASNIYRTADADLAMARPIWLMDWKYVERMCDAQEDIIKTSKGHFCDLD